MKLTTRYAIGLVLLCWVGAAAMAQRPAPAGPADYRAKQQAWERHRALDEASPFRGLEWRNIGPVVQGGRVVDIESVPGEPYTFYVAYASGGLWRTRDNGVNFEPLFDEQPTLIMGDVAIDPNDSNTIWVGTGENNSSRSSYGGMGVFRSRDAGATWQHVGLGDSDRIGRIIVDPRDSNRVYVGVLGKLYTEGGERGVYRTTNGGRSWQRVLDTSQSEMTGVIDMVMHPRNPDILFAATWERSRRPWNFVEGGGASGIYKSVNGGDTWERLQNGLPVGEHVGRIGLAVAASQPDTLYASIDNQEPLPEAQWDLGDGAVTPKRIRRMTVEQFLEQDPEAIESFIRQNDLDTSLDAAKLIEMVKEGELTLQDILDELDDANANLFNTDIRGLEVYRSDDAGRSWRRTHEKPLRQVVYTYGYYFGQIRVSPTDPERIYCLGVPLITSADGGKSFSGLNARGVHVDHQAYWIDPNFSNRLITGNDGGLDISYDGGKSWIKLDRQPVGQFYTVAVDMDKPYNVYGGLQDNGTLKGSSRSRPAIDTWRRIGGGDGMYVEIDSRDGTTYTGFQFGYYFRSKSRDGRRSVRPRDKLKEPALRYNWSTPILLSQHNEDILYFGANRIYRSLDQGDTWAPISDDLTTSQNRGDVPFGTMTTLAESPHEFGLLWAGTDDGHVWVTEDGGVDWRAADQALPRDRWVTRVEASHHERDRVYVSLSGYRDDDIEAYVFASDDLGRTWRSIAGGLPREAVNVVREDPVNAEVLYVGTDRGVYVSLDRGDTWNALPTGMPNVPVHDLVVHPRDRELVAGTHGRSMYVLDVLPIQDLDSEMRESAAHVFPVEEVDYRRSWARRRSEWFYDADNDPELLVPFWSKSAGDAELEIMDDEGRVLRRLSKATRGGVETFSWDLLLDPDLAMDAEQQAQKASEDADAKPKKKRKPNEQAKTDEASNEGRLAKTPWAEAIRLERPLYVTPGEYTLRLQIGDANHETKLKVKKPNQRDPRSKPKPKIRGRKPA